MDELVALGLLAGYSMTEVAEMLLAAVRKKGATG